MYLYGKGTKRDIKKALYWYSEAAKRGDIESQKAILEITQFRSFAA
jgi:TPR repeat protein